MKKKVLVVLTAALVLTLGLSVLAFDACGSAEMDPAQFDLVFLSETSSPIATVEVSSASHTEGACRADSAPLSQGESFGFTTMVYPATVTAYRDIEARQPIAELTVETPPPEGGRWYVTVTDGPSGIALALSDRMPEEAA